MSKIIAFSFVVLLAACGRSECADYCTVACDKGIACDAPPGTRGADRGECARTCLSGMEAARSTDATCKKARETVQAMTCEQYRAFIAANTR